jgi:NADH dehydrogenase FAD-containing subunit
MPQVSRHHALVLGGGYAGLVAAARIARAGARVTLVDARDAFVQRIRLHELLAGRESASLSYAPALARRGVAFLRGTVERLDLAAQSVSGVGADGTRWRRGWDTLVVALGSRTAAPVPGVAAHAARLDDPAAVRAAAARIAALPVGARAVVVGGGATAIEAATEVASRYPLLRVALVAAGAVGGALTTAAQRYLRARLAALGIDVREGSAVAAVEPRALVLRAGGAEPFDVCVWAAGFEAPALLRDAGLATVAAGRVAVDPYLRARGHENVFVAGDAAAVRVGDDVLRMGCATAQPIGAHVGENVRRALAGESLDPFAFGYVLRCLSLGRRAGLIQFTDAVDAPTGRALTGGRGALVKELVARATFWGVRAEVRRGLAVTAWNRGAAATVPVPVEDAVGAERVA